MIVIDVSGYILAGFDRGYKADAHCIARGVAFWSEFQFG
jgi:hypothetical protein